MRLVAKVIFFFPFKFYRNIYFYELQVYYRILLFLFLLSHIFPWVNKFLSTEDSFLPRLTKQESYSSSHCIFQSVYALNTRSIKIYRSSVVKVIITLLIKQ